MKRPIVEEREVKFMLFNLSLPLILLSVALTWAIGGFIRNSAREGDALPATILSLIAVFVISLLLT